MWMDDTCRVVLFGHRDFNNHRALSEQLYPLLCDLVRTRSYVEIYVGRNGAFDLYAATVIKRVQNVVGKANNALICVLPYTEKDLEYYEKYYDEVVIPECIGCSHPKAAIIKRNRWMVEQADLFVCYVERKNGGAYTAWKYAKKLGKQIINLANKADEEE